MKWVLILFLCFSCFAWDTVEETKAETKSATRELTTGEYVQKISGNVSYIKYSLFPYDDTFTHPSIYELVESIPSVLTNEYGRSYLQAMYDGFENLRIGDSNRENDKGIYDSYYTDTLTGSGGGLNLSEVMSINEQSYGYMSYIRSFSTLMYSLDMSGFYPSPDHYLNYPDKFSFVEPIAKAFDEETTDFQPETLKNVLGMQKINSVNTFVDEIMTDIAKNPNETTFDSSFLVGGSNFADTTFHIDLSSIGQLWVNLVNKYGNGSSQTPTTRSVITTNPFKDWVFDLRLRPQQGDYLYPLYTWWNSDNALPRAIRYTLQALVYAYTFYYCFTYTKELWSK